MRKFTGFDDLRSSILYPKSAAEHEAAKAALLRDFEDKLRALSRPPPAVVEAAITLRDWLEDRTRRKPRDLEALAIAALHYLFGVHDAIPDTVEFVGFSDDSIVLDAVVQAVADSAHRRRKKKTPPARRANQKPAARKPAPRRTARGPRK